MKPRVAMLVFVVAMLIVHALLVHIYPLQREDWSHWVWHAAQEHRDTTSFLRTFFATHFTVSDIAGYAVARSHLVHVTLTPIATVAMVFGIFVLAFRRLPGPTWSDTLAIVMTSAMIWIAQSHPGPSFFHGSYVATYLYGTTIAIWFLAAYLCNWQLRRWQQVLIVFAGLLVGASAPQVAITSFVVAIVLVLRTPRAQRRVWMWAGVVTVAIGSVLGFMDTPQIALKGLVRRGFEENLELAYIPFRECGQLVALMMLLGLGKLVVDRLRPANTETSKLPDPRTAMIWTGIWVWFCAASLLGPRVTSGTALPATVAVCVASLPFLSWLASTRLVRYVVIAIAIGVHLVRWVSAARTMLPLYAEFEQRMQILETTPKGEVAVMPPYSVIYQDAWFFGEDWQLPGPRQLIAIRVFGLRDIEFLPSFGRNELNPHVAIRFESTGLSSAQLAAASAPSIWATELVSARQQFDALIKQLRRQGTTGYTAQLVVDDLRFPELAGRPLLAAWFDGKSLMSPRVSRTPADATSTYLVRVPPRIAARFPEAYVVSPTETTRVTFDTTGYSLRPLSTQRNSVVACDKTRCLALDAFIPWF